MKLSILGGALVVAAFAASPALSAEKVTAGSLTFVSSAPLFLAQEKGYFAAEGLDVEIKFFGSAQPIAVAIASNDVDFGVTAFTAGLFNLAGKGALKVIAAQLQEVKGFEGSHILVSNKAYAEGVTSVDKLKGHSFALSQVGSSFHYMIGRLGESVGFKLSDMDLKPLQSVGNMVAALKSGQVDSMIIVPQYARALINAGEAKSLGQIADYAPYQVGALFTSPKNVDSRRPMVEKFVRAYQKGIADYRAAFVTKKVGEDEILGMIHKYVYKDEDAKAAYPKIRAGVMYIEEDGRMDVADIYRQVEWYKALGHVDATVKAEAFVDTTFVKPLTMPGQK